MEMLLLYGRQQVIPELVFAYISPTRAVLHITGTLHVGALLTFALSTDCVLF